jgi:AraC family transcriptional regulator
MDSADRYFLCRKETEHQYRRAVERVIGAMHEHVGEEFPLDEMARVAIMSPFHLNRVFRKLTGVPPCRFLTALRLETAKRLLLTSAQSVTDISLDVGYNSLGTFTRRFSELVGVPPSIFRNLSITGVRSALNRRRERVPVRREWSSPGVSGSVDAPGDWCGPIFVGLFASCIPQGRPVACTQLSAPGPFRLPPVPDGTYFLGAVGLPWSLNQREYLLYEHALRDGFAVPLRIGRGVNRMVPRLVLRSPQPIDPPILLTLPLPLSERPASPVALPASIAARQAGF